MAPEIAHLASPVPSAGGRVIVSPFQFAVDGSDHLLIEGWNTVSGASLQVSYRFAARGGRIVAHRVDLALTADRVSAERVVPLQPGYLINLVAFVTGATPKVGQTFMCIKLQRGLGAAAITLGLLAQGYATREQGLAWPGSPIVDSISVGGVLRLITGTNPAAGTEISETVPTGARWELSFITLNLTTGAVVNDRRPTLLVDDGAAVYLTIPSPGVAPANEVRLFQFQAGHWQDTVFDVDTLTAGLPTKLTLLAGHRIRSLTSNLAAADNYAAPIFEVREWLEVDA